MRNATVYRILSDVLAVPAESLKLFRLFRDVEGVHQWMVLSETETLGIDEQKCGNVASAIRGLSRTTAWDRTLEALSLSATGEA